MKRFLVGFIIGASVGAAVVIVVTPHSGQELLRRLKARFDYAVEEGIKVYDRYEADLWSEFYARIHPDRGPIPLGIMSDELDDAEFDDEYEDEDE